MIPQSFLPFRLFSRGSQNSPKGHRPRDSTRPKHENRSKGSSEWMKQHVHDPYVIQSQQLGYRSRAAFKLLEIDEKYNILTPNARCVDIGAAPGSWSQVLAQKLNPQLIVPPAEQIDFDFDSLVPGPRILQNSQVISIDLLEFEGIENVTTITQDFTDPNAQKLIQVLLDGHGADLICSDMAPNASGNISTDHGRLMNLVGDVWSFSKRVLDSKGTLLTKITRGGTEKEFIDLLKPHFSSVLTVKPPSSRQNSNEIYCLARNFSREGLE